LFIVGIVVIIASYHFIIVINEILRQVHLIGSVVVNQELLSEAASCPSLSY